MIENFHKKILKNGMTILFEKREVPVVSVAFAIKHGGIHEDTKEKGISHFIEHMLYKGTSKRNHKQIGEEIEGNGGELNGFTSEEVTAYWCRMPSKHIGIALDVLGDMVKNPLFDEKELEKERKVIFEEIKMYKDNPRMHVFQEIQEALYSGTLGMNLAGTFETMKTINREKILRKFKEVYTPNNLILVIVGDADFDEIVRFAESNFGNQKGRISHQKFGLVNKSKIEKRKGIDQANLVFAYHVPLARDKKAYTAMVLNTLMAGGFSSRLFEEIREKRNLAYAVKGDSNINKEFAFNSIYVGTTKENVENVKNIILKEFKKVQIDLTEKELRQTKEQIIGNYQIGMEDSQNQMTNLLFSEINRKAEDFYDFEKKISEVKLKDVCDLANLKKYSFYALVPE